jgi:hypothetical protein
MPSSKCAHPTEVELEANGPGLIAALDGMDYTQS